MDLHPIFVHFPIALLTIYAVLEMARFRWFTESSWWVPVKTAMVIFGGAGAVAAYLSGSSVGKALEVAGAVTPLLTMHSTFAFLTLLLFSVIAISYVIVICQPLPWYARIPPVVAKVLHIFSRGVLQPAVVVPLALLGLVLLTITGALGGALVYGTEGDPIVRIVTEILL